MTDEPRVVVVGEGISLARPDSCTIGIVLNVMRDSAAGAIRDVAAAADLAIAALRDVGLRDADLPTRNLSVRDWFDPQTREVAARVGSYQFAIVVRDLAAVSTVVEALAGAVGEAFQIQGIAFTHSNRAPLEAAARHDAVEDAKARAEQLAAAAGVRLGRIETIHEGVTTLPVGRAVAARAPEFAVPIEPGVQQITVRVTVAFGLDGSE